jgi:hypothetical protein
MFRTATIFGRILSEHFPYWCSERDGRAMRTDPIPAAISATFAALEKQDPA